MPITVGSGAANTVLNFSSNDASAFASALAGNISAGMAAATFTSFNYTAGSGSMAPEPSSGKGGVVTFSAPTIRDAFGVPISVFVGGADQAIIDTASGPLSIQGGAAGGTVLAGTGGLIYTNIKPSGTLTDSIAALGGNNLIQTMQTGMGNYNVQTGDGNDTVNILSGNSTVNTATGSNQVNVGNGQNLVYSEGYDTITGSSVGGGTDTVNVGSGQSSVNTGTSSFIINDSSPNALTVELGAGGDTVNFSGLGSGTFIGVTSGASVTGVGTVVATEAEAGDNYTITGRLNATVTAGLANEVIDGHGDSGTELFSAGTGNDTLMAGQGAATLMGGQGAAANTTLVSGATAATTFAFNFVNGQPGGHNVINQFKNSDVISFAGFGSNPQGSAVVSGGSTVITLVDGTTINITGATPVAGQYRVS